MISILMKHARFNQHGFTFLKQVIGFCQKKGLCLNQTSPKGECCRLFIILLISFYLILELVSVSILSIWCHVPPPSFLMCWEDWFVLLASYSIRKLGSRECSDWLGSQAHSSSGCQHRYRQVVIKNVSTSTHVQYRCIQRMKGTLQSTLLQHAFYEWLVNCSVD